MKRIRTSLYLIFLIPVTIQCSNKIETWNSVEKYHIINSDTIFHSTFDTGNSQQIIMHPSGALEIIDTINGIGSHIESEWRIDDSNVFVVISNKNSDFENEAYSIVLKNDSSFIMEYNELGHVNDYVIHWELDRLD